MSASSLDLTSIPRRSSFSTSTSFDLGSRRSMSSLSLTDRTSGDEVDGDSRRVVFRRHESILETIERQRRENISRKLRQIRQSAPVPTAGRLGTLRRHRPSDEERPSETVSAVGPQTSKPLPVALPTIVPFNRTVSTSALQNMMLTTSLRTKGAGLGSGSGNGSASSINGIGVGGGGSGPMRANWSIGTSMAAAKRSSTSSQDCDVSQSAGNNSRSQLMTSAATKRNIEKWWAVLF
jgi:hypothetical protein